MASPFRVLDTWFALHLTVGVLFAIAAKALTSVTTGTALLAGALFALAAAVGLRRAHPDLDTDRLWRVGFVGLALAVLASLVGTATTAAWLADADLVYPVAVGLAVLVVFGDRYR